MGVEGLKPLHDKTKLSPHELTHLAVGVLVKEETVLCGVICLKG